MTGTSGTEGGEEGTRRQVEDYDQVGESGRGLVVVRSVGR